MVDRNNLKQYLEEQPDFINSKKHHYSLKRYLKHNPVSSDNTISLLLCLKPQDVKDLYDSAVRKLRKSMKMEIE